MLNTLIGTAIAICLIMAGIGLLLACLFIVWCLLDMLEVPQRDFLGVIRPIHRDEEG
jgi:hypothetical protein